MFIYDRLLCVLVVSLSLLLMMCCLAFVFVPCDCCSSWFIVVFLFVVVVCVCVHACNCVMFESLFVCVWCVAIVRALLCGFMFVGVVLLLALFI